MSGNNNSRNKYNRNRSFGGGGGGGGSGSGAASPTSPTKNRKGHSNQPARRSMSHDASKLKEQFIPDDDGFTTIGSSGNKKKGGRFDNSNNNNAPRGRMNPTSSFTRPRSTQSFNKPRPTGSFNKKHHHRNSRSSDNLRAHGSNSSGSSLDGSGGGGFKQRRTQSFNKPRPTGSFNAKHNYHNHMNNSSSSLGSNNVPANAQAKRELYRRSTSRLTADDVELYTQGDGKSQQQRHVVRLHVDVLMRARLSLMDPPSFGGSGSIEPSTVDTWNPHHKCLWNDPTRRDQIEQVMQQYPNAIPLHLKKRTRIVSSKLGDNMSSSGAASVGTADESEFDDASSVGALSIMSGSETDNASFMLTEEMNPLRKTLLLLNKLSWTTIDKLTPKLFQVLEQDVPNLLQTSSTPPATIKTTTSSDDEDSSKQQSQQQQDLSESSDGTNSNSNASKATPPPPNNNATEPSPMVLTILHLIVEKAQDEPHFSAMYAQLCKNLAARNPAWKKKILAHCQTEFEHDIAWHTKAMDERMAAKASANNNLMEDNSSSTNATEDMDREYQVLMIRKKYLGHVTFIGELFKLRLIKLEIMIWCLSRLLFHKDDKESKAATADEDDLECFAKLMTVVGQLAETLVQRGKCHAMAEDKWYECWDRIYWLTGRERPKKKKRQSKAKKPEEEEQQLPKAAAPPPKISSRIKFMLVDLLELEENDWVHRRQQDKAKTIAEIHEEVREEEEEARRRSYSDDFSSSSWGNRRRGNSDDYTLSPAYSSKPQKVVDADGFIEIPKRSSAVRRAVSDVDVSEIYNRQSTGKKKQQQQSVPASPKSRSARSQVNNAAPPPPKIVEYPDPQECKDKTKTILKEYFVGGDTQDAILSIEELVGKEADGSLERGAAVIEAGVLLVMEMKQQEVQKFLAVVKRCLQQKKIAKESLPMGLQDPLEFLSDIEIDAPLARTLLTSIVAYLVRQESLNLNFLLEAPEFFRIDGKPAEFAVGVLKVIGQDDSSEDDLAVVEQLMTEEDKKKFSSAKQMLA